MPEKKTMSKAMKSLSPRARKVVKTSARETASTYKLKPKGAARYKRQLAKEVAGSTKGKGYIKAAIKTARKSTTKAEAKGVRKVLTRQAPTPTHAAKRKVGIPKRGKPKPTKSYGSKQVR